MLFGFMMYHFWPPKNSNTDLDIVFLYFIFLSSECNELLPQLVELRLEGVRDACCFLQLELVYVSYNYFLN